MGMLACITLNVSTGMLIKGYIGLKEGGNMDNSKLRTLAADLKTLSVQIHAAVSAGLPVDDLIDIGLDLDVIAKTATKELEPIKASLRQAAVNQNKQQSGSVELRPGVCQVRIPEPKVTVRKNYDMAGLKSLLGPAFPTVFSEVTTYKPQTDFQDAVSQCDPAQQNDIMGAVEMKDGIPQVFFKE